MVCIVIINMLFAVLLLTGIPAILGSPLGRITGGRDGDIREVPYQVSILVDGSHNCGGAIISEFWVLSAAHCHHRVLERHTIRVGNSLKDFGGVVHAVETIINHNYNAVTQENDITLLKVVEPFQFSAEVQPIVLPEKSEEARIGAYSVISGFGNIGWMWNPAIVLQIAEVPVVSQEQCRAYLGARNVYDDMLCAGFDEGGADSCVGDSGGPLAVDGVLHGIVSWGGLCGSARSPGVYARVTYFRDWIKEHSGL